MEARRSAALAWGAALGLALAGCGESGELEPAEAGLRAYRSTCTACHHLDPGRDGPTGPAVACASLDLLEARILRGEYPPGYAPKRDTRWMPAQPFLADRIPGLAAYLASVCPE